MISRIVAALICLAAVAACTSKTGGQQGAASAPVMLEFRKVAKTEPADGKAHSRPAVGAPADQTAIDKAKSARQQLDVGDPDTVRKAFEGLDCAAPDPLQGKDEPTLPLITCDPALPAKYSLEPAFLTGADVERAQARLDQNGVGWVVDLTFRGKGAQIWADFTAKNVNQQVAVVVDARVVSAPEIRDAILGGATVISGPAGGFTKQEAEDLARKLVPRP